MANMARRGAAGWAVDGEPAAEDHELAPGAAGDRLPAPVHARGRCARTSARPSVSTGWRRRRPGWGGSRSGSSTIDARSRRLGPFTDGQAREGFKELVARVCLGEVGAIFGLEVSQVGALSRGDCSGCLSTAALTDTLVIDTDGIYDLQRLQRPARCSALKGQMSRGRAAHHGRPAAGRQARTRPSAASCASRCRSATSTTMRARRSSTPTRRSGPRSPTCSRRSSRPARRTAWSASLTGRRFPQRAYGGAWAGELRWGRVDAPRGCVRMPREPLLRRGVRVRALPLSPRRLARTARSPPRSSSCRARSGRS